VAQFAGSDGSAVGMLFSSIRRSSPQRGQGLSVERTRSLSCTTARLLLTKGPTCDHPWGRLLVALSPISEPEDSSDPAVNGNRVAGYAGTRRSLDRSPSRRRTTR